MTTLPDTVVSPWRFFSVSVARVVALSPSFVRVTFTGDDLDELADTGLDTRIKLVLPDDGGGFDHLPDGPDWYAAWRDLPDAHRNPLRTYTPRAARPELRELDVDLVLHGTNGPAGRFAATCEVGTPAAIMGPNARYEGLHGGREFVVPEPERPVLLVGDETALPAVARILEALPEQAQGHAVLEVPHADDVVADLVHPRGVDVSWVVRDGGDHGADLVPRVREIADALIAGGAADASLDDVDVDADILWEVPTAAPEAGQEPYAWLAGEAGVIKTLRRYLVSERGLDRRSVAFMGYWRLGRAES